MLKFGAKLHDARIRWVAAAKKFLVGKEEGASAVEYGLLVALIAAVIVTVVKTLGTKVQNGFTQVSNNLP
jgi:pilus assembly protein Flp/PilA